MDAAAASDRARPSTLCPASISSRTIAEPMKPEAPVTKTRIFCSSFEIDSCLAESLLTDRQDFGKTESVSELLDNRRLSPVTYFFMPKKLSKRSERKPRADAQRNRERVLEVAKAAFARSGAHASLDDIAKQAGVGPGTLYRHFPTRDALIEAVYHTEVERLAAAQRELSANLPPIEALRAWMMLFVDYIATKQIIASALNSVVGGSSRLYDASRAQVTGAINALVKTAMKSGDVRKDLEPFDLLRALIGFSHIATGSDWQESARRLVDILIKGSRPIEPGSFSSVDVRAKRLSS